MRIGAIISKAGERAKAFFASKKKVMAGAAIAATLVAGVFGLQANDSAKSAGTPRFNFLQGDKEMLRVAKTTDSTWGDPVTASVGDRVAFIFYYHNGKVDTTAHNTTLRVDLPAQQGTQLKATSYLWSSETAYITDTVVDGQIVGQSGATINTTGPARIEYVPGTSRWFPNGSQTGQDLPDGIVSASGINIGDIQGCWQYSGYVTFLADIKGQTNLVMDKKVAHPGETTWHDEINANPGDSVVYDLGVRNDGNITAQQVTVKDILPTYMTYETGTTYLYTAAHPEGVKLPDTLYTTGVSLPDVIPGQSNSVYITYRARVNANIPAGSWSLNNVAKVFQAGVEKDMDQAKVNVTADRGLVIDKKVSNGTSWVEQSTARIGDTITYRIVVRNTGNIAVNSVVVRDIVPMYVSYVAGSTTVDGVAVGDQIVTTAGLSLGNIPAGGSKTITLRGRVYGCPPIGGYTLTNTAYTWAIGITQISDTAVTIVNVSAPTDPTR
ncbi:MAG: DUF11 domain-containing protein [Patescibacteria group bacterium]|jgi:uncharacterized repeat protein (TIGR01451 family)